MIIGFGKGPGLNGKSDDILKKVSNVDHFLRDEITSCEEFNKMVLRELKTIDDLKFHLNTIISQMDSLRKLAESRERVIEALTNEYTKAKSEWNIAQSRMYLQTLNKIDSHLIPMMRDIECQVRKLFIDESHKLYTASVQNKKIMKGIDSEARKILAEITRINYNTNKYAGEGSRFWNELELLENERERRPEKARGKVGF